MQKTFLYETHVSLGAKMAPFGGFLMPIQYEGIFAEHFCARKAAVVFDTCHMGEFLINGPMAVADLEKILSCPVSSMNPGQCRYGFICNENGGVMDDQILYRLGENDFYMVVNASTQDADFEWVTSNASSATSVKNISKETGKIDLQGPKSLLIINKLLDKPVSDLKYYHWMYNSYKGIEIIVSRTGYTGEIGFELYLNEPHTISFWNDCLLLDAKPAGLGARDTLRLEMGYPLYGHELDEKRDAAESGFSRAISRDKSFIGSSVVLDTSLATSMLCGIQLDGRRAARNGDRITDSSGAQIGIVTSGSFSPSLECAIAMGYVAKGLCLTGNRVKVLTGSAELTGTIVELPFYKNGTARKKLSEISI
jgi:aminomethyltransferase